MREQIDGHSLDAQESNIQKYVADQGWTLVQIYTDAGVSAKKGSHRPMFERLMQAAQAGEFDVVVVDKIDRFYRHLVGLLTALDKLNTWNVGFVSVQERLDFTTPWGKLTLTMLGMLAEIYIDNLRQETRKGLRQRARNGYLNGSIPYGYCKGLCQECTDPNGQGYCPRYGHPNQSDGKILIPHPIESEIVKQVYAWYLTGDFSDALIAEKLNGLTYSLANGNAVPVRQKGGPGRSQPGAFTRDSVREMLLRVSYTGKVPYYGTDKQSGKKKKRRNPVALYPGKHPALIAEATFHQVQELRSLLSTQPKNHHAQQHRLYLLTGLLRCGYCGGAMRGSAGSQHKYYRDATQIERTGTCHQPLVRAEQIETQVVNYLKYVFNSIDHEQVMEQYQQQKDAIAVRWERAQQLYLDGDLDREQYDFEKNRSDELEQALLDHTPNAIITLGEEVYQGFAVWNRILPIKKKRLLQLVLEAVYVKEGELVAVQPSIASHPLFSGCCSSGDDGGYPVSK